MLSNYPLCHFVLGITHWFIEQVLVMVTLCVYNLDSIHVGLTTSLSNILRLSVVSPIFRRHMLVLHTRHSWYLPLTIYHHILIFFDMSLISLQIR